MNSDQTSTADTGPIKRILVGLGTTPFTTVAIQRAIELAQHHNASLTGVTVVDFKNLAQSSPLSSGSAFGRQARQERLRSTVDRLDAAVNSFKTACKRETIEHSVEFEVGDPFKELIGLSRYYDLIILGLRGLFDFDVIDEPRNVLRQLVSQGARPILAVAPQYRPIERAMIAYSGSSASANAMKRFVQWKPWGIVPLHIVCFGKDRKEADALLADAADYCQTHGFDPEVQAIAGSLQDRLFACAEHSGADLIVMGSSVRKLVMRQFLGDSLLHAIRHADRPLFLGQ